VPGRFAGIDTDEWQAVLDDAARVGLLTSLGMGMYQVHPALPGYLAAGWHAADPAGYDQERQPSEQALRAACAAFARWLTGQIASGDAAFAYALIRLQRRTLAAMLGVARPSLNKVLKDLERDGLIRISYSTIEVPDPAKLAARA